jgi:hypothetical protein
MGEEAWRPTRWTAEQLEERRLAAAVLLRNGRLSQAAIGRRLGVSRASVCRWAATLASGGRRGLRARPRTGLGVWTRRLGRGWAACWNAGRWRLALTPNSGRCGASRP